MLFNRNMHDVTEGEPYISLYDSDMNCLGTWSGELQEYLYEGSTYTIGFRDELGNAFQYQAMIQKVPVYGVTYDLNLEAYNYSLEQAYFKNDSISEPQHLSTYTCDINEGENATNVYKYNDRLIVEDPNICLVGWSTEPDASEPNHEIIVDQDGMILYAVWSSQHTVTYDLNREDELAYFNEEGVQSTTLDVPCAEGTRIVEQAPYVYNDSSIVFLGWARTPDAEEPDTEICVEDEDLTVYAVWDTAHKVTYDLYLDRFNLDLEQVYFKDYYPSEQEFSYNPSTTYIEYKQDGEWIYGDRFEGSFDFVNNYSNMRIWGWSTNRNADKPDEEIIITEDTELFAIWKKQYEVTFDLNLSRYSLDLSQVHYLDANEEPVAEHKEYYFEGSDIQWSQFFVINDNELYFAGWSTKEDANEVDDNLVITEDTKVYAVWKKQYPITYHLNTESDLVYFNIYNDAGEEETSTLPYVKYCVENESADAWDYNIPLVNEGQDLFLGWSTKEDAKDPEYNIIVDGPKDLYAVWKHAYNVTLDPAGGYFDKANPSSDEQTFSYYDGELFDPPTVYQNEMMKAFDGWYTSDGEKYTEDTEISDNVTLYAHWKDVNEQILHADVITQTAVGEYKNVYSFMPEEDGFYVFSSADISNTTPKVSLYDSERVLVSEEQQTLEGNNFRCIYNLEAGKTYYYVIDHAKPSEYAYRVKIEKVETANVTYDSNRSGATINGQESYTKKSAIGFEADVNVVPEIEDENAVFVGWTLDKESQDTIDSFVVSKDLTLYGVWRDTTTITFHANLENASFGRNSDSELIKSVQVKRNVGSGLYMDNNPHVQDGSYSFMGWSTKSDATEPDSNIIVTKDLKNLYAVWFKNDLSKAKPLKLNEVQSLTEVDGRQMIFSYTPDENGQFVFEAVDTQNCFSQASILDSNGESVRYSNYRNGDSFYVTYSLEKGETYYFHVWAYPNGNATTWNFKVKLSLPETVKVTYHTNHENVKFDDDGRETQEVDEILGRKVSVYENQGMWFYGETLSFEGWSTNPDATKPDSDLTIKKDTKDLYAVWSKRAEVTFDANREKLSEAWYDDYGPSEKTSRKRTTTMWYRVGEDINDLYYEEPVTNGDSLQFLGWSTKSDAAVPDDKIIVTEGLTIYAVWGECYAVTFDANGGHMYNGGTICALPVVKGSSFSITDPVYFDETKVFAGWATSKDATEPDVVQDETAITADMDLYAVWEDASEQPDDQQAKKDAAVVDKLILQIGEVTLDSGDAIKAAREAYDALSDEAKAKVTKLNILTDAEESFDQLQNYTGLYEGKDGWVYLTKGKVDATVTGLFYDAATSKWYFIEKGKHNQSFVGVAKNPNNGNWYFVKNGTYDKSFTGVAKSIANGKWYFVRNGQLEWTFTGFGKSVADGNWYFVKNGELDWTFTGFGKSAANDKWYFAKNGKLDWSFTGFGKSVSNGKWYFAKNGALDWTFTGFGKSVANGKWYFARKGELDWNFTGVAKSVANGKWYFARKGELDWNYTGGAKSVSNGKWYYVKKGELDWTYTGKAKGTDGVIRNYVKGAAQ